MSRKITKRDNASTKSKASNSADLIYRQYIERTVTLSTGEAISPLIKTLDKDTLKRLSEAAAAGQLTLVLGAGVSMGSGLPLWGALIDRLAAKFGKDRGPSSFAALFKKSNTSEVRKVRVLEQLVSGFRLQVQDELYRTAAKPTKSIKALSTFIGARSKKHPINIITYNFDDLLETALEGAGIAFQAVCSSQSYITKSSPITIFHPHGYLPRKQLVSATLDSPIVFSEPSFHREYFNYANWSNIVQLHAFTRSTCLFIGLSFADPNVRRLLDLSRLTNAGVRHVAIRELSSGGPQAQRDIENQLIAIDLTSLGVEPLWVNDYADIPKILRSL